MRKVLLSKKKKKNSESSCNNYSTRIKFKHFWPTLPHTPHQVLQSMCACVNTKHTMTSFYYQPLSFPERGQKIPQQVKHDKPNHSPFCSTEKRKGEETWTVLSRASCLQSSSVVWTLVECFRLTKAVKGLPQAQALWSGAESLRYSKGHSSRVWHGTQWLAERWGQGAGFGVGWGGATGCGVKHQGQRWVKGKCSWCVAPPLSRHPSQSVVHPLVTLIPVRRGVCPKVTVSEITYRNATILITIKKKTLIIIVVSTVQYSIVKYTFSSITNGLNVAHLYSVCSTSWACKNGLVGAAFTKHCTAHD